MKTAITLFALLTLTLSTSCVSGPSRIPVQTENGIVHQVRRASYPTTDTVLIRIIGNSDMKAIVIAGNYNGVVPEADTIKGIAHEFQWATKIK